MAQSRPVRTATVLATSWLNPSMVRVELRVEGGLGEGLFADSYVKLLFDGVPRAYTVRRAVGEDVWIDFVVHGDEGLAGPWAAAAVPGNAIEFVGPGGAWSPRPGADLHVFIGDESALPAIASGLERLGGAPSVVFAEIAGPGNEYPLDAQVTWVHRGDALYGSRLVDAVLAAGVPAGDLEVFLHGNAEMVRPLRRWLLREVGLPREHLSASGYWRAGLTDEAWRATKRDFNAAMEAETS